MSSGGAADDDLPVLEDIDLFEPDPSWTLIGSGAIQAELATLLAAGAPCLLRPRGGPDLVAQLLAVDVDRGRIEWRLCGLAPDGDALSGAARVGVSATLGRIDLFFECDGFAGPAPEPGRAGVAADPAAWSSAIPGSIHRVQRREAYRLRMRPSSRGGPVVHLRLSDGRSPVPVRVLNLSVGGCCLLLPPELSGLPVRAGTVYRAAKVVLKPDIVLMTAAKVVWSGLVRDPEASAPRLQLGCAWQGLAAANERVIQQYLDTVQRQRRMLRRDGF